MIRRALPAALLAGLMLLPAAARVSASPPTDGLPHYDHVFVLVEENESIDKTYGPGPQTYLKTLRNQGAFADHYYGTSHQSLDNYIAMLSGQGSNGTSNTDCAGLSLYLCALPQGLVGGGGNLADQLDVAGATWAGYMDGTTAPCQHAPYGPTMVAPDSWQGNGGTPQAGNPHPGKDYADRHNPFLYFPNIIGNDSRCQAHVRPYTELAAALQNNAVPQFGFITPDTCHDGHDSPCAAGAGDRSGGLGSANSWLASNLPPLLTYLNAHRGLLLITTDEGNFPSDTTGCCTGGPGGTPGNGGRVGLVALGPGVNAGHTVSTQYDHASLLRTLEGLFGISEHLNDAGTAKPMTDLFAVSTVSTSPTPS
ncbi:MAG: alkaline phosphatase family protein, partial [Candidatus Dormibacteria bacterium]